MKNIIKKLSVLLVTVFAVISLVGCFGGIDDVNTLEFGTPPQATYYQVSQEKLQDAINELYDEIIIKIDGNPFTLNAGVQFKDVEVSGLDLNTVGTHTLIIKYKNVTLTYVYRVVSSTELFAEGFGTLRDPFVIKTAEQFQNIGTRVLGVPRPLATASEDAWKGYYSLCFPYLSNDMHFVIASDLDFEEINYTTMGTLGDKHYVPFRGTIKGDKGDGAAPVISNLVINSASPANENTALFAGATATWIENLKFVSPRVVAGPSAEKAALLWTAPGVNDENNINVVMDVEVDGGYYQAQRSGGLVLESNNTIFVDCSVKNSTIIGTYAHTGGIGAYASGTERSYYYYEGGTPKKLKDGVTTSPTNPYITNLIVNAKCGTELAVDGSELPVYTAFVNCSVEGTTIHHPTATNTDPMVGDFTSGHNAKYSVDGENGVNTLVHVQSMVQKSPLELYALDSPGCTYEYFVTFSVENGISTCFTVTGEKSKFYENGILKDISLKYSLNGDLLDPVDNTFQVDNSYTREDVSGQVTDTYYFTPKLTEGKVLLILVVIENNNGVLSFYSHITKTTENPYKVDLKLE